MGAEIKPKMGSIRLSFGQAGRPNGGVDCDEFRNQCCCHVAFQRRLAKCLDGKQFRRRRWRDR